MRHKMIAPWPGPPDRLRRPEDKPRPRPSTCTVPRGVDHRVKPGDDDKRVKPGDDDSRVSGERRLAVRPLAPFPGGEGAKRRIP